MQKKISVKFKLLAAAIPFALVAVVWLAAPKVALDHVGQVSSAEEFADASANYTKYCGRCHGGDGRSQTAKGKQTNATDLTKSRIGNAAGARIIANGKGQMSGYSGNMSAEEISALMGYIRGFRQ